MKSVAELPTLPLRPKDAGCCALLETTSLSLEGTQRLADRLKAVGDATRLRLLDLLAQQPEPACVCDLTAHFEQNQPTISHHLRTLRQAGLVATEKRGIWAYYWATSAGKELLQAMRTLA